MAEIVLIVRSPYQHAVNRIRRKQCSQHSLTILCWSCKRAHSSIIIIIIMSSLNIVLKPLVSYTISVATVGLLRLVRQCNRLKDWLVEFNRNGKRRQPIGTSEPLRTSVVLAVRHYSFAAQAKLLSPHLRRKAQWSIHIDDTCWTCIRIEWDYSLNSINR